MLTLLNVLVGGMSLTCGGIFNLINATGRIRWFKLNTSVCFIACIPIGYVLFREGYPAYSILVLFLVADVVQRGVQLYLMRRLLGFDAWLYAREAYGRPLVIALMAGRVLSPLADGRRERGGKAGFDQRLCSADGGTDLRYRPDARRTAGFEALRGERQETAAWIKETCRKNPVAHLG